VWRKSLWLFVPLFLTTFWAAYTWHKSTHFGPFVQFPHAHPQVINQEGMKAVNKDLVVKIEQLAEPEKINLYLESIGFTCKSYFGADLKKRMASANEVSNHYCVYAYGLFGRTHEWRVGYSMLTNGDLQSARTNQICLICP
jgi:hypothetical protein